MNWLERHYREFVFPVLRRKLFGHRIQPPMEPIEPYEKEIRPALGCSSPEAGMLSACLSNWVLTGIVQSGMFKKFKLHGLRMDDNDTHSKVLVPGNLAKFSAEDLIHNSIKNSVRELKAALKPGNKVILLGRDVWVWVVMCEKMGVPYVYDPVISRDVARHFDLMVNIVSRLNIESGDILFDTGFMGSIFIAVREVTPKTLSCLMLSANDNTYQQFPNNGLTRNKALFIEYLPKYFSTGRVILSNWGSKELAVQPFSTAEQFIHCALLTNWLWYYQSPNWVPGPVIKVKGGKRVPTKLASHSVLV